MKKNAVLLLALFGLCNFVHGQAINLSLEEAIALGLKNNFSIQIARNDTKIAVSNNTAGNAGFLPNININGGVRENINSSDSESQSGESSSLDNQHTGTINMAVTLDWTLFNGLEMFLRRDKLGSLQSLQNTAMQATVENTIADIITAYFAVVQLKSSIQVMQNAINFSNSRYELTRKKLQVGTTSELAFLKSSTDLNADSASFLRQNVALASAKSRLSTLLVLENGRDLEVTSSIGFDNLLNYNSLKEILEKANSQINMARQSVDIAMLDYRLTHSPKYPEINFFSDYNWSQSNYNWGSTARATNAGPVVGVTLSLPLFDGFNKKRLTGNARIEAENKKLEYEQVLKNTEALLRETYVEYQSNLKLVTLETANLVVARHTSKISFESFRVGEMSDYELRNIQLSELEAENSLLTAQFQAKKSETELLRLSGKLIESKKKE